VGLPLTLPGGFGNSWVLDIGLYLYDFLAGRRNIQRHRRVSREQALKLAPSLKSDGLRNAFTYYDAQLDDARLTLIGLRTAARWNAAIANHAEVIGFQHQDSKLSAAEVRDKLTGRELTIRARHIVNAGGIWAEQIEALTGSEPQIEVQPSKGAHLVVARERLGLGEMAVVLPQTEDNRILFVIPWEGRAIIGTTDTGDGDLDHPAASAADIDYLIRHVNHYFNVGLTKEDIISTYAGYRPLVRSRDKTQGKNLSRTHAILENPNGLVSIVGGKLTTWRLMGQDTVDHLARRDHLPIKHPTERLPLLGAERWREVAEELPGRGQALGLSADIAEHLSFCYGGEALALLDLIQFDASLAGRIVPDLPFIRAEVAHACRAEMALTLQDMLARRTRIAIEDRERGLQAAEEVAALMALQLGWSAGQTREQISAYRAWADKEGLTEEAGV
ncbi:MAG TPA: glycerol-3-phosphate dehydrogenase/oxidase, partial [Ktedonobacterales bacterium]